MIVDAHLHVWELASKQYPWNPLASVAPDYSWPIEQEIEVMDRYGIDRGILVQPSMYRFDNRYLIECARRYPGRFQLVGLLDPQDDSVEEKMEELAAQGVRGLRLGPMLRPDIPWFNDPKADRVWRKAGEIGMVITLLVIPSQLPAASITIERFPDTLVIIDHLARPDRASSPAEIDALFLLAVRKQVYVKVSALSFMSKETYPHKDIQLLVKRVYDGFGPGRMLWGTDTPMSQKTEGIPAALQLIDLALPQAGQADLALIKGGTAERLFGWN